MHVKGKTCIGISPSKVIISVHQDGVKGSSLGDIRDSFIKQKCRYAAFLMVGFFNAFRKREIHYKYGAR